MIYFYFNNLLIKDLQIIEVVFGTKTKFFRISSALNTKHVSVQCRFRYIHTLKIHIYHYNLLVHMHDFEILFYNF